jgi:hypothetical protein
MDIPLCTIEKLLKSKPNGMASFPKRRSAAFDPFALFSSTAIRTPLFYVGNNPEGVNFAITLM